MPPRSRGERWGGTCLRWARWDGPPHYDRSRGPTPPNPPSALAHNVNKERATRTLAGAEVLGRGSCHAPCQGIGGAVASTALPVAGPHATGMWDCDKVQLGEQEEAGAGAGSPAPMP